MKKKLRLKFNYNLHVCGIGESRLKDGRLVEFIGRIWNEWDYIEGYYIKPGERIERGVWDLKSGKAKEAGRITLISEINEGDPYPGCEFKLVDGNECIIEMVLADKILYSIKGYDSYHNCNFDEFSKICEEINYSSI